MPSTDGRQSVCTCMHTFLTVSRRVIRRQEASRTSFEYLRKDEPVAPVVEHSSVLVLVFPPSRSLTPRSSGTSSLAGELMRPRHLAAHPDPISLLAEVEVLQAAYLLPVHRQAADVEKQPINTSN